MKEPSQYRASIDAFYNILGDNEPFLPIGLQCAMW